MPIDLRQFTGHAPGPWVVAEFADYDKSLWIDAPRVEVDYDDVDRDEAEANAYLVAAAPELLTLCIRLANLLEQARQYVYLTPPDEMPEQPHDGPCHPEAGCDGACQTALHVASESLLALAIDRTLKEVIVK